MSAIEEGNEAIHSKLMELKQRMAQAEDGNDHLKLEINDSKLRLARLEETRELTGMKVEDPSMKQRMFRLEGAFVTMLLMLAFFYVVMP